ncbi:MAG: PLD nuclease N-terminal domain-containing protein [Solirubrobacterales bacterium]
MLIAETDYPFLDIVGTMLIFFAWMAWLWIAITIFADIFRRKDMGGFTKALWCIFVILVPFVGVLIYLIAYHNGMAERNVKQVEANQAAFDDYVRKTAGGGAEEIAQAKKLLDEGTINQSEFETLKARATGAASS